MDPAKFYHERHKQTMQERAASPMIHFRLFQNFIKSVLISDALAHVRYSARVLDMCCGQGGDIAKYQHSRVSDVHAIDIARGAVDEARRRFIQAKPPFKFKSTFLVGDAFDPHYMFKHVVTPDLAGQFDLVNCQFALHYAFENERKVDGVFEIISRALKPGGKFIATVPNAALIRLHLEAIPPLKKETPTSQAPHVPSNGDFEGREWVHPPFFRVVEDLRHPRRYFFTMEGAVENVPEYFVEFDWIRAAADKWGFTIEMWTPFVDVLQRAATNPQHVDLMNRLKLPPPEQLLPLTLDGFYLALVMRKATVTERTL